MPHGHIFPHNSLKLDSLDFALEEEGNQLMSESKWTLGLHQDPA